MTSHNLSGKWDRRERETENNNTFYRENHTEKTKQPETQTKQVMPKYLKMISSCTTCLQLCERKQQDGVCYLYYNPIDKKFYRSAGWLHS